MFRCLGMILTRRARNVQTVPDGFAVGHDINNNKLNLQLADQHVCFTWI